MAGAPGPVLRARGCEPHAPGCLGCTQRRRTGHAPGLGAGGGAGSPHQPGWVSRRRGQAGPPQPAVLQGPPATAAGARWLPCELSHREGRPCPAGPVTVQPQGSPRQASPRRAELLGGHVTAASETPSRHGSQEPWGLRGAPWLCPVLSCRVQLPYGAGVTGRLPLMHTRPPGPAALASLPLSPPARKTPRMEPAPAV